MHAQTEIDSDQYIRSVIIQNGFLQIASNISFVKVTEFICKQIRAIEQRRAKVVAIVGGAACGKTKLTNTVASLFRGKKVIVLCTDDYSIGTRDYRRKYLSSASPYEKYDFQMLNRKVNAILNLQANETDTVPVYNEKNGAGVPPTTITKSKRDLLCEMRRYRIRKINGRIDLLIIEGDFQPMEHVDYAVYLHLKDESRLENRIKRDLKQRNYGSVERIIESFNKRQFEQHYPLTLKEASRANMIIWATVEDHNDAATYKYDIYSQKG